MVHPPFQKSRLARALGSHATALTLGAVMLASMPRIAGAQSPSQEIITLPEVTVVAAPWKDGYNTDFSTVGGGEPMPFRDIPQTVTIVNSALMQAQGATSLADALRNVPGITIGAAEGGSIGG